MKTWEGYSYQTPVVLMNVLNEWANHLRRERGDAERHKVACGELNDWLRGEVITPSERKGYEQQYPYDVRVVLMGDDTFVFYWNDYK